MDDEKQSEDQQDGYMDFDPVQDSFEQYPQDGYDDGQEYPQQQYENYQQQ